MGIAFGLLHIVFYKARKRTAVIRYYMSTKLHEPIKNLLKGFFSILTSSPECLMV